MTGMTSENVTCAECGGTGWILESADGLKQARPCSCRAAALRRDKLEAAGIPERYRNCTLQEFSDTSAPLTAAKGKAREFVDCYPAVDSGLLLVGPSGRGKTHLACAILSELILTKGAQGLYADFSDLLIRIQTTFRADADSSKESLLTPFAET